MKIAFNPSTVAALTAPPNNKDITFDLRGQNIFARGVKFYGTDTNTWRDIKINNVSIGSHILDLRNGSNTTLTNTNGVVTINSTWRPVVDNLTSDSTTSSLSANLGRVLAGLINGKSDSDHNHDDRYLKLIGGTLTGNLVGTSAMFSGRFYGNGDDEGIIIKPSPNGYAGLILGTHDGERSVFYYKPGAVFWRYGDSSGTADIYHPKKSGIIALTSDIPSKDSWNYDDRYIKKVGGMPTNAYDLIITPEYLAPETVGDSGGGIHVKAHTGTSFLLWLHDTSNVWYKKTGNGNWTKMDAGYADVAGSVTWDNVTNKPATATRWPSWDEIANKPNTFTPSDHNHDGRYVYNYGGTQMDGVSVDKNALGMSTNSGITGDWWHILQAAWNGEYRWNSLIAFPTLNRNGMYYRSGLDDNTKWGSWVKLLDTNNYPSTLDSRYYTESEVNSLLSTKLDRVNLSTGGWNPRGYNLAADYYYNGGDLSISESGGLIHVTVDGYFWLNEGQYRVLDTSDVAGLKGDLTVHLYLSNTDTTWWPLIWGGSSHNNTSNSTGAVYKSHDVLSWQTSSLTLYATRLQTTFINLENNRGISGVTSGGTSPFKGMKLPDLQSSGIGIFSKLGDGNGADEGGIIISADTSVIYNSFDTGWGLTIRDKDKGLMDISGNDTIAFGIRQDYKAYSLGGFEKAGSSNSYVLLGGGDHKLESALNVANADMVDGYHENSFLRYREHTNTNLEVTLWSLIGIKEYYGALPDGLTNIYDWGSVISLSGIYSRFEIYASHISSSGNGLYYRSGWGDDKKSWLKFIDSSNIGSQSVNYANSAGSAISATKVIVNLHTSNDINYPLVWSNLTNTSNVTENQLYKSWADLYYNPKNKRLTVGGSVVTSSFIKSGGNQELLLRADGGVAAFNWSGLAGQPTWLWGGNDFNSYYVYNPSNFRVAYASSAGSAETLGGMPKNYGQAPFGTIPCVGNDGIMEIGRYIDYHYDNSGKYDFSTRLLTTGNYANIVNLPSASGTLALISQVLTWKSLIIDMRSYSESYWHPVTVPLPYTGYNKIKVSVLLNSGDKPSWATHNSGITCNMEIWATASGWGTTDSDTICLNYTYKFCSQNPCGWMQLGNPSLGVVFLRGGSRYTVYTDFDATFTPHNLKYTWSNGGSSLDTGGPYTSCPGLNFNMGAIRADLIATMVQARRVCAGHDPGIDNSISCSNWFRSSGNTGWYNTTYLGGWYMSDTSWIRAHNSVGIYTGGQIYSSNSIKMGNICLEHTDEINNITNGGINLNYRNSGNISLCQGGGHVGIGTMSPTYKLDVNGLMRAGGFHHANHNSDDAVLLAGGNFMMHKTGSTSWSTAILFGKYVWLTLLISDASNGISVVPTNISNPTKDIFVMNALLGNYSHSRHGRYRVAPNGVLYYVDGVAGMCIYTTICYVAYS